MEQKIDIEKTIRDYLDQVLHMSLATVKDGKPWVCEVHFAWDDELNIYFCSSMNTRHCQEVEHNPHVSGNIVEQHAAGQKTRCVAFEGTAEEMENIDETHPAFVAYTTRHGGGPNFVKVAKGEGSARLYKITVSEFYLADARESMPPQKYHLPWHK